MATLWELFVAIRGDNAQYKQSLNEAGTATQQFGTMFDTLDKKLGAALGFGAIGAGAVAAAKKFEDAGVQIQRSTGATGDKLSSLEKSFTAVYTQTGKSADQVSSALTLMSTRTGATGRALETLTLSALKLTNVHREEASVVIPAVTQAFAAWGKTTGEQVKAIDYLRVVAQQTGSPVVTLTQQLTAQAPQLQRLGYNFEQAAVLIGEFDKAGVIAQGGMTAFRKVIASFEKDNKDATKAWAELTKGIQDGTVSYGDFIRLAGNRGGGALFEAIRQHRTDVKGLSDDYKKAAEDATKSARTISEQFTIAQHHVETFLGAHYQIISVAALSVPAIMGIGSALKWAFAPAVPLAMNLVTAIQSGLIGCLAAAEVAVGSFALAVGGGIALGVADGMLAALSKDYLQSKLGAFALGIRAALASYMPGFNAYDINPTMPPGYSESRSEHRKSHPPAGGKGGGDEKLTDEQYKIRAAEIEAAAEHQKNLLEIERMGYQEREKFHLASAEQTAANLQRILTRERDIELRAIDQKMALEKQKADGSKDATLAKQRIAVEDAYAKKSVEIEQHVREAKEHIYDQGVHDHVAAENKKREEDEKTREARVRAHVEAWNENAEYGYRITRHVEELNKRLAEDQNKAARMSEAGEMEHGTRMLEMKREQADYEQRIGRITAAERLRIDRQVDKEEEALQRKAILREIELLDQREGLDTDYASKKQELENKLKALDDKRMAREQRDLQSSTSRFDQWVNHISAATKRLTLVFDRMADMAVRAFDDLARGMARNIADALVYQKSIGAAIQSTVAAVLAGIAAESIAYAIYATALGFLRLAQWDFPAASAAFTSAAIWGSVGVATAIAGQMIAPKNEKGNGNVASAAGGWADVPFDNAPAVLHKNEMVLPADIAVPLRQSVRSAGIGSGGLTINGTFNGVTRETVTTLATQIVRQARLAGARI